MSRKLFRRVRCKTLSKGIISQMYTLIKTSDIAVLLTGNATF